MVESQSELVATMREVLSYVKGQVITIAAQVRTVKGGVGGWVGGWLGGGRGRGCN